MAYRKGSADVLEEKHSIDILLYLLDEKTALKSTIYRNISTNPRMPEKLDKLADAGLITQSVNRFEKNSATVRLTPRGEEVAELLSDSLQVICERPRQYTRREERERVR